jgi:hypothetical protein
VGVPRVASVCDVSTQSVRCEYPEYAMCRWPAVAARGRRGVSDRRPRARCAPHATGESHLQPPRSAAPLYCVSTAVLQPIASSAIAVASAPPPCCSASAAAAASRSFASRQLIVVPIRACDCPLPDAVPVGGRMLSRCIRTVAARRRWRPSAAECGACIARRRPNRELLALAQPPPLSPPLSRADCSHLAPLSRSLLPLSSLLARPAPT